MTERRGAFARLIHTGAIRDGLVLAALVAGAALVVGLAGSASVGTTAINLLVLLIAVLALSVFSGNSGILSFGHVAFMALGAQISATLTIAPRLKGRLMPDLPEVILGLQLDLWLACLIAVLAVMVVAAIVGIALAKLPPMAFTLSTLGVLIIVNSLMVASTGITRGNQALHSIPKATTLPVAAGAAAAAVFFAYLYRSSLIGLRLRASRENEAAAGSIGIHVAFQRRHAFVISAGLAALAGALMAHHLTVFTPKTFYMHLSFTLIVMMVFGGMASVTGAVIGTVCVFAITETARQFENGFSIGPVDVPQLFGLTAVMLSVVILITLYRFPAGLLGFREISAFLPARRTGLWTAAPAAPAGAQVSAASLTVRDVSKNYGGVQALQGVSFTARTGEILGLIGPNGSGKSTLLACIAGTHPVSAGQVQMDGTRISGLPPHRIARMGLARTFQTVRLFNELTVLENVVAAIAARGAAKTMAPESEAMALLDELGVGDLAEKRSADLAYGQGRRVEIARALALNPAFLLLDEPAAGMNEAETENLLHILRALCGERGLGLIIVDHDMHLIMRLCDRIVVLNKGRLIADGAPDRVRNDPQVREAYLGRARSTENNTNQNRE